MIAIKLDLAYVFAVYPPSFREVFIRSNKGRSLACTVHYMKQMSYKEPSHLL